LHSIGPEWSKSGGHDISIFETPLGPLKIICEGRKTDVSTLMGAVEYKKSNPNMLIVKPKSRLVAGFKTGDTESESLVPTINSASVRTQMPRPHSSGTRPKRRSTILGVFFTFRIILPGEACKIDEKSKPKKVFRHHRSMSNPLKRVND